MMMTMLMTLMKMTCNHGDIFIAHGKECKFDKDDSAYRGVDGDDNHDYGGCGQDSRDDYNVKHAEEKERDAGNKTHQPSKNAASLLLQIISVGVKFAHLLV